MHTIFTNEQLAEMVQKQVTTKSELEAVAAVGSARMGKYGDRILDLLQRERGGSSETDGAAV